MRDVTDAKFEIYWTCYAKFIHNYDQFMKSDKKEFISSPLINFSPLLKSKWDLAANLQYNS